MPEYEIRGITVKFPFKAYDCQIKLMETIINSLQQGQNALIESPTGTGKTLCMLCAVLSWRECVLARKQLGNLKNIPVEISEPNKKTKDQLIKDLDSVVSTKENDDFFNVPRIYYASRTHAQLSQAIAELKKLKNYSVRAIVLGSRDQTCMNSEVLSAPSGTVRTAMCRQRVSKKSCEHYVGYEGWKKNNVLPDVPIDIEDLLVLGKQNSVCPYYLTKDAQTNADIIFLPYNYLVDSNSRAAQNIDLQNSIIIFDEGHNLETSCVDASSFELTPSKLSICIAEAQRCVDISSNPYYGSMLKEATPDDFLTLRDMLIRFEEELVCIPMHNELIKPGEFIYELFSKANIHFNNAERVMKVIDMCMELITHEAQTQKQQISLNIGILQTALKIAFKDISESKRANLSSMCKNYKVHIQKENHNVKVRDKNGWKMNSSKNDRILSFWCFSSGVAMQEIMSQNPRSAILASGTLSPLDSFAVEMGIPFKLRLENPHVIKQSQVLVGVVGHGPMGHKLNSSYNTRDLPTYISDLGNTIANFTRIIPDGLLVFFPSYGVMTNLIEAWKKPIPTGGKSIWERINQHKPAFVEPKTKSEFAEQINKFYEKLNLDTSGASFFAVCRGKASEGIDFSDSKGRAVIICGLPFPAAKDPKVLLKKQFMDELSGKGGNSSVTLTGNEWYTQQAARAVNQAIGRVIRHKDDFGAILLCDERFSQPGQIAKLPLWVRPYVTVYKSFGDAQVQIAKFFRSNTATPAVNKPASNTAQVVFENEIVQDQISTEKSLTHAAESFFKNLRETMGENIPNKYLHSSTENDVQIHYSRKQLQRLTSGIFQSLTHTNESESAMKPLISDHHSQYKIFSSASNSNLAVNNDTKASKLEEVRRRQLKRSVSNISTTSENSVDSKKSDLTVRSDTSSSTVLNQNTNLSKKRSISTPLTTAEKSESSDKKGGSVFVELAKKNLLPNEYNKFQSNLRAFKAKTIEADVLYNNVFEIFMGAPSEKVTLELMSGFGNFVPKKYDAIFKQIYQKYEKRIMKN